MQKRLTYALFFLVLGGYTFTGAQVSRIMRTIGSFAAGLLFTGLAFPVG